MPKPKQQPVRPPTAFERLADPEGRRRAADPNLTANGAVRANRAAQFMPFAALTGYFDLIREQEWKAQERFKKDRQRLGEIDLVLCDQQSHGASPGLILKVFCPERKHFHSASPVCSRPQVMFRLPLRQRRASRKALGTCASRSVTRYCSS